MRKDRKREIQAKLEEEKALKKKKGAGFKIIAIIYVLLAAAFIGLVYWLNVLPAEYFIVLCAAVALVTVFIVPLLFSWKVKTGKKVVVTVIALLMIAGFAVGSNYMMGTIRFLDDITQVKEVTEDYYVLVKEDAPYQELQELSGMEVGSFVVADASYAEAKVNLQNMVNVEFTYDDSFDSCIRALLNGEHEAVFVSSASYESAKDLEDYNLEDTTRILETVGINIEQKVNTSAVKVKDESFNILISGNDLGGVRSDVNMVATVNPETHKVLLTSIPRDYLVTLPSKNAQDKLTHSSIYGIQETVGAVEGFLGIDINYYVRVNYNALKGIVNALGGIDVESDYTFTTSGMKELNGHHFVKGMNHMDGDAALAFCRERHSFSAGDMQRNKNQQAVLKAILEKATTSTAVMSSYTSILEAIGGNMETNMSQGEMSLIIKTQLKKMPSWDIERQSITGKPGTAHCYALGMKASVVFQNEEENAKALDGIMRVMKGGSAETAESETEEGAEE